MKFWKNFPYEDDLLYLFKYIAHTLTFLNSMLNPFFYTMGNSFRLNFGFKMSRYSTSYQSSKNNFNRASVLMKSGSKNESMRQKNTGAYRYNSIAQRRET